MIRIERTRITTRRRLGVLVASASLLVAGLVGVASPAQAAYDDCGWGRACGWSGYDYTVDWFWGWNSWTYCYNNFDGGNMDDNSASSFYNNGNLQVAYMYQDANARGTRVARGIKTGYADLGAVGFNDVGSSGFFSEYISQRGTTFCD